MVISYKFNSYRQKNILIISNVVTYKTYLSLYLNYLPNFVREYEYYNINLYEKKT